MKMIAPLGKNLSDTFHASIWSHDTVLAGKSGNTHVVPPICRFASTIEIYE
jgi:hypothetical protein